VPDHLGGFAGWLARKLPRSVAERYFVPVCCDLYADAQTGGHRPGLRRVWDSTLFNVRVLATALECLSIARTEARRARTSNGHLNPRRAGVDPMLIQDARFALRMLRRNPAFTGVATFALALGIGAGTAIFSVVHAVLLRPLPYADPSRIVRLTETAEGRLMTISPPNLMDWKAQNRSFEAIGAYNVGRTTLTGGFDPEILTAASVDVDVFTVLGVPPLLGRAFTAAEARPGGPRVVVIGHTFWQQRFGGDRHIIGRALILDGTPSEVVGVMPAGYSFPQPVELWLPLVLTEGDLRPNQRGAHYLNAIARLRPGVTLAQAIDDLGAIERRIANQFPQVQRYGIWVQPVLDSMVGGVRRPLLILLGAVAFVLLIACTNVSNLLLARATTRRTEIAVRSALGAGRWRLTRQLLVESVILALAGGLLGVILAAWGVRALAAVTQSLPRSDGITVNTAVLLFSVGISVLTGIVFGVFPAFYASTPDLSAFLKDTRRDGGEGGGRRRFRSALVAVEVALALVLLAGAGLAIRSFERLSSVDPGFDSSGLLVATVTLPDARYPDAEAAARFFSQYVDAISTQPGVEAAGAVMNAPLGGGGFGGTLSLAGRESADELRAQVRPATAGYLETLRIPLRRGRLFSSADRSGGAPVAIVTETAARQFWPGEDPVGKRLRLHVGISGREGEREVVGVVGDVKLQSLQGVVPAVVYVPHAQYVSEFMTVFVRGAGDPMSLLPVVKGQLEALDPELALTRVRTGDELVAASIAQPRFRMLLLGLFAAIALLLAAVGLYGVMTFSVSQRVGEIGLRMALGADRSSVMRLVLAQGMLPVAIGLVAGLAGAAALTRVMSGLLYGVSPYDPLTFLAVSIVLAVVAAAAIYIPARRAMTMDPLLALRHQ
jgi:putative ABC transport system permease protein